MKSQLSTPSQNVKRQKVKRHNGNQLGLSASECSGRHKQSC